MLVVTGGAVRLTASGLGCPTWPRCTDASFTPHGAYDVHSAIEFGNRMLTFVLAAIAIATFVAAWQQRPPRPAPARARLGLGIPAQAVIGGITVLTDLNPWIVSFHLLLSMAIIGLSVLFLQRLDHPAPGPSRGPAGRPRLGDVRRRLGGALRRHGRHRLRPHAGDVDAPRNGLDPLQLSQLHADVVFLFVGLTLGLLFARARDRRGAGRPAPSPCCWRRARARARSASCSTSPTCRSCSSASTCSAPRSISASVTWVLVRSANPPEPAESAQSPPRDGAARPGDSSVRPCHAPSAQVSADSAPAPRRQRTADSATSPGILRRLGVSG